MNGAIVRTDQDERPGYLGWLLEQAPATAAEVTQVIIDNPFPMLAIGAGTVVAVRLAGNLVRPRTALEALALMAILQLTLPKLAHMAIDRGWLTFRVRDLEGRLVPVVHGKAERDVAVPAP